MDKKSRIFILIIILAGLVPLGLIYYYNRKIEKTAVLPPVQVMTREEIIKEQLKQLEQLRSASNSQPLTEEEIKEQLNELDALKSKSGTKPLTQEQIQKQLEELNKLKNP